MGFFFFFLQFGLIGYWSIIVVVGLQERWVVVVVMVGSDMMGELWVMVGFGSGMGFVFVF